MKLSQSFFTSLECSECRTPHSATSLHTVCSVCGKALLARYDLIAAREGLSREALRTRSASLWRYRELLPVFEEENILSLGEGFTPVLKLRNTGKQIGVPHLFLKEEGDNPTGSFKARGLCMAVSKGVESGVKEFVVPTAGNAGGALAAYAALAGLPAHIYMPEDTPVVNVRECRAYGADVHLVKGVISDAARVMNQEKGAEWFDVSTLKEPYRLEGKKTLGFEIAEQFDWVLPDVIVYPTGGGTGLIGMWKAFGELEALGWIDGRRPRMIAVQSAGCAPIVRAYQQNASVSEFWENADTIASGLRVPKAFADTLILKALSESNGCAVEVSDDAILETLGRVASEEGVLLCPEGAATIAALGELKDLEVIDKNSRVVVFNTGSGLKYYEILQHFDPK